MIESIFSNVITQNYHVWISNYDGFHYEIFKHDKIKFKKMDSRFLIQLFNVCFVINKKMLGSLPIKMFGIALIPVRMLDFMVSRKNNFMHSKKKKILWSENPRKKFSTISHE